MAENEGKQRKPRIRKTAPTVRQKIEEAQHKSEEQARPKAVAKINRLTLPAGKATKRISPVFRPLIKLVKWLTPRYLANSWVEMRQVQWPARKETWRLTLAVFIFAIVFGALVAGVDKGLDEVFKKLVLK